MILASILCTISITTNTSDFTRYKLAMYFIPLAYAMCRTLILEVLPAQPSSNGQLTARSGLRLQAHYVTKLA
ncbi:hypothetical protein BDW60DRAFT_176644 [Aspergillus nidulans var. acristatus]|jgi:hypothetical protein